MAYILPCASGRRFQRPKRRAILAALLHHHAPPLDHPLLVFLDGDRFSKRPGTFLGVAAAIAFVCLGVRLTSGALTCLMAINYVWDAWHFASQHHGIYRIYGRFGAPDSALNLFVEKWLMRTFLLYVILRVATASWTESAWDEWLYRADWMALFVPLGLVVRALLQARRDALGRPVYLISMCGLYACLLWAVHERRPVLILALATASALFHAMEYLSLVSHLAPRWGIALTTFIVVLGVGGWLMDQQFIEAWLFINVIVAFLHYAYDGPAA